MRKLKNAKGTIFIIALVTSMLMILVAVGASNMLLQDSYMIKRLRRSQQARYIAEAGLSEAVSFLLGTASTGWSAGGGGASFAEGAYAYVISQIAGRWLVESTGTVQGVSKVASMELENLTQPALQFALATGGDVSIKAVSGSITVLGDIHANGDMLLKEQGSPTTLRVQVSAPATGRATSVGTYSASMGNVTVDDAINSGGGRPAVPMPVVDFASLRAAAQATGTYYPAGQAFNNGVPSLNGGAAGIVFVDGAASFTGANTITGGFVADGDITMNNGNSISQIHDATNNYPIFMSNGALMKLYGNFNTIQGNLVFATNLIKIRTPGGGSQVLGCVIAGGDLDVVANADTTLTYFQVIAPLVLPEGIDITSWNR